MLADDAASSFDIPSPDIDDAWEIDTLSSLEENNWEVLDEVSEQKKWNKWAIHKTLGFIIPIAISLAFLLFIIALCVYVAHILMPILLIKSGRHPATLEPYIPSVGWWDGEFGWVEYDIPPNLQKWEPTHWMPLPTPPQEPDNA